MKKILVCGGSGFIGLNLVKYFSKLNYKILATYNTNKPKKISGVKWIKSDLTSLTQIKKIVKDCNIIIQCAAFTAGSKDMVSKPFMLLGNNVIMNSLLIKEATQQKIDHFIFLSCSVMYHHSNKKLKETDYDPRKPLNYIYEGMALTKVYIENMCKFYAERSRTKFSALRHTNIYGPHDKFNNKNSHFMAAAITKSENASKNLVVWGKGNEKRDFLYIDDLCDAIKRILKKQKINFDLLNISYGKSLSVNTIVKKIKKITNKKYKIRYDKKNLVLKSIYL